MMTMATEPLTCPMCPYTPLDANGRCPDCWREWEEREVITGERYMASKPRRVKIVAPLIEGAKIDDCIKPVEHEPRQPDSIGE
jgi:hypothetical protein